MTTSSAGSSPATLADLEALADDVRGEIIDGVLYVRPRPRGAHQRVVGNIAEAIGDPFDRARGGPGGWIVLIEPGISAGSSLEFSPDVAGWRRDRLAHVPDERIDVTPDWVCEVLSPSTSAYDQKVKRAFYARLGIGHYWLVDVDARVVTVLRNESGRWVDAGVFVGEDVARAEPFDAVDLRLAAWWRDLPPPRRDDGP